LRPIVIASPNLSLDRTIAVDALAPGHVHRATRSDVRGGGKGVNVARALGAVGDGATVVGLTAGRTGEAVVGMLADEGVDVLPVACPGETRSCVTVVPSRGEVTVFNEAGPDIGAAIWDAFAAAVDGRLTSDTVFVCSGSFPPGSPPGAAAELVTAARERGAAVICDTSGAQLAAALEAGPDIVVPNLAEAESVLEGAARETVDVRGNSRARAETAARALVTRGARAAVVTAGSAGAVTHHRGVTETWSAHRVTVLNPVGAGDCLVAGIAAATAAGDDFATAMRRGTAMAAASTETFAAGVLDADRYESLLGAAG
jgi:1-phosphofructokinase family hexose kinase